MIKPVNSGDVLLDRLREIDNKAASAATSAEIAPSTAMQEVRAVGAPAVSNNYEVLIKFKPGTSDFQQKAITTEMPMRDLRNFPAIPNLVSVTVRSSEPLDNVLAQLKKNPNVEYVELNREFELPKPPVNKGERRPSNQIDNLTRTNQGVKPGDRFYDRQWVMNANSPSEPGSVNAEPAWQMATGSRDVVVAVLDTGMDYNHPDLARNVWRNQGEVAGDGIDNDNNGVVDDVHGFNAAARTGNPMDDNSHGTMVSGIIGADGDNNQGVAGVNWRVQMMPIKIFDGNGRNKLTDVLVAIDYVIKMKERGVNIRVLNNSWGGDPASPALRDAIQQLDKAGIVFVAAAGNSSANNDEQPSFPASYDLPNVITVAATDRSGKLAGFSNFGVNSVHIAAPGEDILTTYPNDYYNFFGGTSGAAPFVSGAAALLLSMDPSLTPQQVRERLMETATRNSNLDGKIASGGLLNIGEAVKRTPMQWIAQGQQGDRVKQVQELLNNFGYNLAVDGDFGSVTDQAVRDFQRKNGLLDDGQIGPLTLAKLRGL